MTPPKTPRTKRALLGALLTFGLIQLVPYGRDHENPPMGAEPAWDSPRTRELFMTACGDCHSHATVWPWYTHIAPASWLVMHDVMEGREHFNVSGWPDGARHADDAAEEYAEGEMPPGLYTPLHPEAELGAADREALLTGLRATFGGGSEHH
ncbi:MAG: heme-binding domain-containing protein [Sandaracinaceae bacterium]|nr:heme-binding domain-containing protein [Myxococcales bacterium]MCB9656464.1 heme-binding domain-containing protein [Sandaracinaceae bacterium]